MKKSSARSSDRNHFKTTEIPFWEDVVYCDAGVHILDDEITVDRFSLAFWNAKDLSFAVKSFSVQPTWKRDAASIAEFKAIMFALDVCNPEKVKTDSRSAIAWVQHLYPELGERLEWIPREKNGIANMLCKSNRQGTGYIAFNSTKVERGWMHLVWD